jgi:hypothetical protein
VLAEWRVCCGETLSAGLAEGEESVAGAGGDDAVEDIGKGGCVEDGGLDGRAVGGAAHCQEGDKEVGGG